MVCDLRSAQQREVAMQCYHRACTVPHEMWKDISISGKHYEFSKDGSLQFPSKGVLSFQYRPRSINSVIAISCAIAGIHMFTH